MTAAGALERGRAAFARLAWAEAYAQLTAADRGAALEPEDLERLASAAHLLGRDAGGQLQASLRIVPPGLKYDEASIGRVVTSPSLRGSGLGIELMTQGVRHCERLHPARGIRISAQAHLQRFYRRFDFEPVGEPYLEDNIPHIEMLRPASVGTR